MKEISQEEMTKLLKNDYLHNSGRGIINRNGDTVGFCRTKNKRYIEDKYVILARTIK